MTTPEEFMQMTNAIRTLMQDTNTCLPGEVVSYDPATRVAVIRPGLDKRTADGRTIDAPEINGVPVVFTSAESCQAIICVPLAPGDQGMLHFSQRAIDSFLDGTRLPTDPRVFDLNDCFFSPGLQATAQTIPATNDYLLVKIGACEIRMTQGGQMTIIAPAGVLVQSSVVDIPEANVNIDAGVLQNKGIINHTHTHVGSPTAPLGPVSPTGIPNV
ncbi:putative spike protein [Pseudomonas phage MiCath]|uniref:Spike protein n=1 Tax=Pseudomonas phage MiCath TaxID=3003729 RepID=A0A9Y1MSD7_9CAUD|nr:putative spike protein [Pseudomonas phage MiCath]WAX22448.1 putative spike protein [Pseudomonas phage MiCath]